MKSVLLPLLAFILGFVGVAGYQYVRIQNESVPVVTPQTIPESAPEPAFALVPPSQAVSGVLTVTSGHVEKFSRTETEYKEASSGAQILLGESIATKTNSSATAEISGIVKASFGPVAELVFANLYPENMVLQQRTGKIDYTVTKTISVRALHTLITINEGAVIINIIDTDMSITVKTGSVKFALVDNDNTTNVWDLKAGERANIDDTAREVTLINSR